MPSLPPSRFLPADFDSTRPVAVIAGRGTYPALTIEALRRGGIPVRIIAFEDETDPALAASFPEAHRATIKVGQLGAMLKALKRFDAATCIMAGQVSPKRLFRGLHPDLKALTILWSLKERNAETIFGAIAREVEAIGITQLDARAFLDDSLADKGLMTKGSLGEDMHDIEHGIRIAKGVAQLDIGQGCVVRKGTVIAVEAFEGTDPMLRRAGSFDTDHLIFVKTVKAHQDYRFDVPCFGLRTLEVMDEAKIRLACLEAGNTIILEKPAVLARAAKLGIRIYGY